MPTLWCPGDCLSRGYIYSCSLPGVLSVVANIVVLWGLFNKKTDITDMDIININISICQILAVILSYPLILVSAFSHGWSFSLVGRCQYLLHAGYATLNPIGLNWTVSGSIFHVSIKYGSVWYGKVYGMVKYGTRCPMKSWRHENKSRINGSLLFKKNQLWIRRV